MKFNTKAEEGYETMASTFLNYDSERRYLRDPDWCLRLQGDDVQDGLSSWARHLDFNLAESSMAAFVGSFFRKMVELE